MNGLQIIELLKKMPYSKNIKTIFLKDNNKIDEDLKKLNMDKLEMGWDVDPLFTSMTANFNEHGAKGLLINLLPVYFNIIIFMHQEYVISESFSAYLHFLLQLSFRQMQKQRRQKQQPQ